MNNWCWWFVHFSLFVQNGRPIQKVYIYIYIYSNTIDWIWSSAGSASIKEGGQVWMILFHHLLMYLRSTVSICFCWNFPLMISWLLPSTDPLRREKIPIRYEGTRHGESSGMHEVAKGVAKTSTGQLRQ